MTEQHKPDSEFVQYFEDKIGNPFIDSITMMRMEKVYIDQREKYVKILDRQANAAKMGMDAAKKSGAAMYRHGQQMLKESNPEALESERAMNAQLTGELEQARQIIAGLIEFCEQPEIVEATDGAFDPDAFIQRGKGFLSGGEG